ncbi:MAG: hypothetical protein GEU75_06935 [Dehalococcoidia bacterium]|nr:hypothetical protein [Dehalococcoidia bacterium]
MEMQVYKINRRPDLWVGSSGPDPRLESFEDLAAAMIDAVRFARDGTIPPEEPDAGLILSPLEMARCFRQAAEMIELWTDAGLPVQT